MKHIKLYISLLFIICSHYGHSQRIVNGDFAEHCVNYASSGDCSTFANDCIPNWKKSHGSPNLIVQIPSSLNYIQMWARTINGDPWGEGIFGSYKFISGNTYTIKVRAARNSIQGELRLVAVNGMEGTTSTACGEEIPGPTDYYFITSTSLTTSFAEYSWSYTPSDSYSQIWIHPYYFTNDQFDMYVDYIQIHPDICSGTVYFNTGTVDNGNTRGSVIYAGSTAGTGGSGTVTVTNGQTTALYAINDVYLLPEFQATLTSGEFSAQIISCSTQIRGGTGEEEDPFGVKNRLLKPLPSAITKADVLSLTTPNTPKENDLLVYPNPARSKITLLSGKFKGSDISDIRILNEMGAFIKQINRNSYAGKQTIELNVSDLPDGLYVIQVITTKGTFIQKLKKNR